MIKKNKKTKEKEKRTHCSRRRDEKKIVYFKFLTVESKMYNSNYVFKCLIYKTLSYA